MQEFKERTIYVLSRYRRSPAMASLAKMATTFLKGYKNYSYNFHLNGEERVLKRLQQFPLTTFFDVGAHHGDWARLTANLFPMSHVHCFELAPATAKVLIAHTRDNPRLHINQFGLSDKPGKVVFQFSPEHDAQTTILEEAAAQGNFKQTEGQVSTGDAYARAQDITAIDFLKIDVEGMEHAVLAGFKDLLAQGAIKIIQFEYGRANIVSRFLLRDFYKLLSSHGYEVGKIYPNGVEFKPYEFTDEDFIGPNFLAVHRSQTQMIQALT